MNNRSLSQRDETPLRDEEVGPEPEASVGEESTLQGTVFFGRQHDAGVEMEVGDWSETEAGGVVERTFQEADQGETPILDNVEDALVGQNGMSNARGESVNRGFREFIGLSGVTTTLFLVLFSVLLIQGAAPTNTLFILVAVLAAATFGLLKTWYDLGQN